jgi:hypothetical protein
VHIAKHLILEALCSLLSILELSLFFHVSDIFISLGKTQRSYILAPQWAKQPWEELLMDRGCQAS